MSDARIQTWEIVADFSKLARTAKAAAKSLSELEKSRLEAQKNNQQSTDLYTKESDSLDRLSAALDRVKTARSGLNEEERKRVRTESGLAKAYDKQSTAMDKNAESADRMARELVRLRQVQSETAAVQKDMAKAQRDYASATRASSREESKAASSTRSAASAHKDLSAAADSSSKTVETQNKVIKKNTQVHRDNSAAARSAAMSMSRSASQAKRAATDMSILAKALKNTGYQARSWALLMKMIPLSGIASGFNVLAPTVAALGGAFVGLAGTIGPVISLLGALPSMAMGVAGALGGAVTGILNVGGALGKYKAMKEAQSKEELKNAATEGKANSARARAERTRQKQIERSAKAIKKARKDQVRAARDVKDAEEALSKTYADNARRVRDAERSVADAQVGVRRAQEGVNAARKEAARQLQDYTSKLRGAALDEESAVLALEEARNRLAEVNADPGSSTLEKRSADLAVRQAQFALDEMRKENTELEKEAADARRRGIEGSDEVVSAKGREADANQTLADAQEALRDTYVDNAEAVRDSKRALADAREAYKESGEKIVELQQDLQELKNTTEDAATASSTAATAAHDFKKAMEELGPETRKVVEKLIEMESMWKQIKDASGEAMAPGLLKALERLHKTLLPQISAYLVVMAKGTGDFADKFSQLLTTPTSQNQFALMFADGLYFMEAMGDAILNITEYFLGLGQAAYRSGLVVWLSDVVEGWTEVWAESVRGEENIEKTAEKMREGMEYAEKWGTAIKNMWRFAGDLFRAMRPLGTWMLDQIVEVTAAWSDWIKSDSGKKHVEAWNDLGKVNLSHLGRAIDVITDQGAKLFGSTDDIDKTAGAMDRVWTAIHGGKTDTGDGLINAIGDVISLADDELITMLVELAESTVNVLRAMGDSGGLLMAKGFISILDQLLNLVEGLMDVVPGFTTAIMMLMGSFTAKNIASAVGSITGINNLYSAIATSKGKGLSGKALTKSTIAHMYGFGDLVPEGWDGTAKGVYAASPFGITGKKSKAKPTDLSKYKKQFMLPGGMSPIFLPAELDGRTSYLAPYLQQNTKKLSNIPLNTVPPFPVELSKKDLGRILGIPDVDWRNPDPKTRAGDISTSSRFDKYIQPAVHDPKATKSSLSPVVTTNGVPVLMDQAKLSATGTSVDAITAKVKKLGDSAVIVGNKFKAATAKLGPFISMLKGIGGAFVFTAAISAVMSLMDAIKSANKPIVASSSEIERAVGLANERIAGSSEDAAKKSEEFSSAISSVFKGIKNKDAQDYNDTLVGLAGSSGKMRVETHNLSTALETVKENMGKEGLSLWWTGKEDEVNALRESFGMLDTQIQELPLGEAADQFKMMSQQARDAGYSTEDLYNLMPGYRDQVIKTAIEQGILTEEMIAGKDGHEKVLAVMDGSDSTYRSYIDNMDEAGNKVNKFEESQKNVRDRFDQTTQKWKDERDAIKEWQTAIDEARGKKRSVQSSKETTTLDILRAKEEFKALKDEVGAAKLAFDDMSIAGLENRARFDDLAGSIRDTVDRMREAELPAEEINSYIADNRELLKEMLGNFDITEQEAEQLLDDLNLLSETRVGSFEMRIQKQENFKQFVDLLNTITDKEHKAKLIMEANTTDVESALKLIAEIRAISIPVDIGGARGIKTYNNGNPEIYFPKSGMTAKATGGYISGPGTSTSDSIPALLSDGEYVIRTKSVNRVGKALLDYINQNGKLPGFKNGGYVQKFASGGQVASSGGLSVADQATAIMGIISSMTQGLGAWGSNMSRWWSGLWATLRTVVMNNGGLIIRAVDMMVSRMESSFRFGILRMITGVVSSRGAMTAAWTSLVSAMVVPITRAVWFLNNSLGRVVTSLTSFYGEKKAKTPFPVKVSGFSDGGWTGPGSKYQPAGVVHADEFVVRKDARRQIEKNHPGYLAYMNRTGKMPGYAEGGRVVPVNGRISGNYKGHSGIDYAVPVGTPVRAADSGVIGSTRKLNRSYGWHIIQNLPGGARAVYGHMSGFTVNPGDRVNRGQIIGYSGNTGRSTGPHLHFEVATGSLGNPANRALTQRWLAGATGIVGDAVLPMIANPFMEKLDELLSESGELGQLKSALAASQFGSLIGNVVESTSNMVADKLKEQAEAAMGDMDMPGVAGNFGSQSQRDIAFGIAEIAFKRGMGARGALLGIMAAMQESGLKNIRYGDRDSVGLFQQRPSAGWGSVAQIMNPIYSTNRFFDALRRIKGWASGPEWQDIQAVQLSAFPFAYQKHRGRAMKFVQDYMMSKGFAGGGWTGPGAKYKPAGVVHADEFVIKKASRRKIERLAPGYLDHLNQTGEVPGYAEGGRVAPSSFKLPSDLRKFTVYLSYLQQAQDWAKRNRKAHPDSKKHVQIIEWLLFNEGLLGRSKIDGHFGPAETAAWKKWQSKNGLGISGVIDYDSYARLLNKYKVPYNSVYGFAAGKTQPTPSDVLISNVVESNKRMAEFMGYLSKLRGWGFKFAYDELEKMGPDAVPDAFRDSEMGKNGLDVARELAKDYKRSKEYDAALRKADTLEGKESKDILASKIAEMVDLLSHGTEGPYGLSAMAKALQLSLDTTAVVFKKAISGGFLGNITKSKFARLQGDVNAFSNLFKFNKGGIVPGVGNTDSVLALLTPGELVVPKDVVNGLFSNTAMTPPSTFSSVSTGFRDTTSSTTDGGTNITFNTNVYNPIAEESSVSVQKRLNKSASLGLLRGRAR